MNLWLLPTLARPQYIQCINRFTLYTHEMQINHFPIALCGKRVQCELMRWTDPRRSRARRQPGSKPPTDFTFREEPILGHLLELSFYSKILSEQ